MVKLALIVTIAKTALLTLTLVTCASLTFNRFVTFYRKVILAGTMIFMVASTSILLHLINTCVLTLIYFSMNRIWLATSVI